MPVMEGAEYDEDSDGVWLSDRFAAENGYVAGDILTLSFDGRKMERKIVGLIKSGEMMLCTPDENQLMPDYRSFGFAYVTPVLFLVIAMLTMVTTMHRIATNEKTQIGTLKALGFRDRRILLHYTSYGFVIGLAGTVLGTVLGYKIAAVIISADGMMGTYFDLPDWSLVMPAFCRPLLAGVVPLCHDLNRCDRVYDFTGRRAWHEGHHDGIPAA